LKPKVVFGNVAHVISAIAPSISLFKKDYVEVAITTSQQKRVFSRSIKMNLKT
jgi:hypothetical protein